MHSRQGSWANIEKLVFIAKPDSARVHGQPGRQAIAQFVEAKFGITIVLEELVDRTIA